jgi:magnesium chelatase family protein
MLTRVKSSILAGLAAIPVEIEVEVADGRSTFTIIGMGDTAIRESRDRIVTALRLSGYGLPDRILVSLVPAGLKKEGSSFDLAIALGILNSSGQLRFDSWERTAVHGELGLDGKVKAVRGAVSLAVAAVEAGQQEVIVPRENAEEAALVSGVRVIGVSSLSELAGYLGGGSVPAPGPRARRVSLPAAPSLSEVIGQDAAKRAMLLVAAGGHNLLMIGPPGCGKSMMAQRFISLLPPLSEAERLEVVKIHSSAGLPIEPYLEGRRPFREPHYVVSDAGLIGGSAIPRPGEITLAHNGVLFLDEFPEFRRSALEGLRGPLESGRVLIARAKASWTFPARFQLIAAMNPCPCGRRGIDGMTCQCSEGAVQKYMQHLSEPILDRIDLHTEMKPVPLRVIAAGNDGGRHGDDAELRGLVHDARSRQYRRNGKLNALLTTAEVRRQVAISDASMSLLEKSAKRIGLSARGMVRVLRVARTAADLEGKAEVEAGHIAEAVDYRSLERLRQSYWSK